MEKITNYLELIQQIQDITPGKKRLFVQQAEVLHTASFMLWQKKSREC